MFWEIFSSLCLKSGKSPNAVGKDIGASSGSISFWKQGKVPHHGTLLKIAEYFGVSVDYLLGKEAKSEEPATKSNRLDSEMVELLSSLSPEDQDEARRYLVYLNERAKKK